MIDAREGYPLMLNDPRVPAGEDVELESADEVPAYYQRRSAGVWTCLAVLAVTLGLSLVYGYSVIERQGFQIDQIPELTQSLPAISNHLANFERRLADSQTAQQRLASQVQNFDATSKAAILETRDESRRLAAQMQIAFARQMNQQTAAFQAQLASLANERKADQAQIASLQEAISNQQTSLAAARGEYAAELSTLRDRQVEQTQELTSLRGSIPSQPTTFTAEKDAPAAIAPGVTFRLTKSDLGHHRFDGWIESSDQQRVFLHNHGVRTPFVFFASGGNVPMVLVMTEIHDGGASGYLLTPAAGSAETTVASQAEPSRAEISSSGAVKSTLKDAPEPGVQTVSTIE